MKNHRKDRILPLIVAAIGMAATCIVGHRLYQREHTYWQETARSTFREALDEELQRRNYIEVPFYSNRRIKLSVMDSVDRKKEPIYVPLQSEHGLKTFCIPFEKHIHNIERPSDLRLIRTTILNQHPLRADSLEMAWSERLAAKGFAGKTIARTSVIDWWDKETHTYAGDSTYIELADSLVTHYMGFRCEIAATGYLYYPWWSIFSPADKLLLAGMVASCLLLFFFRKRIVRLYRRIFIKEVPVIVEKEVPVIVEKIIEKEIPVVATEKNRTHIYQLEEELFYDADTGVLRRGDASVKITPKPAKLLQSLLEAKEHRMDNQEIMLTLWPDGNATREKLHTTVKRLRNYLSQLSDWEIENRDYGYQLRK